VATAVVVAAGAGPGASGAAASGGPGGCSRPSAGRVTHATVTDYECTIKYFKSLIKTYGQELQNEGEGCPPPPGPNQWEILDETSSQNAQYGATVLVPQIQFGLLYMSTFITHAIAPHYKRQPKEALQLAQASAHYSALGTAWTHAVNNFAAGFNAVHAHDCGLGATESTQGYAELAKGESPATAGQAKLVDVLAGR
jgi:hypothetical protein